MLRCFLRLSIPAVLAGTLGVTRAAAQEPPPSVPSQPPAPPIYAPPPAPYYGPYGEPPPAPPVAYTRSQLVRRSPGAMATGIVLLSVGQTMVLASLPFLHSGDQTCATNGQGFDCSTQGIGAGVAVLAVGLVATAVGLPLIIYGAPGVPRASGAAPRTPTAWAGAPAGNGWRWSF